MKDLKLTWIGDQIIHKTGTRCKLDIRKENYHKIMNIGHLDKIVFGGSAGNGVNWIIKSALGGDVIASPHASIERKGNDTFRICDMSTSGTYVNFVRVKGKAALNEGDIVCFGHFDGKNIRAGKKIKAYEWDLKYKVCIAASKYLINTTF